MKHLDVKDLWVQERIRRGAFSLVQVPGTQNPADVGTKPLAVTELREKLELVGASVVPRRPRWADLSE